MTLCSKSTTYPLPLFLLPANEFLDLVHGQVLPRSCITLLQHEILFAESGCRVQDKGHPATPPLTVGGYTIHDSGLVDGVILKAGYHLPTTVLEDPLLGKPARQDGPALDEVVVVNLPAQPVRALDDAVSEVVVPRCLVVGLQFPPQRDVNHDTGVSQDMVREFGVFV